MTLVVVRCEVLVRYWCPLWHPKRLVSRTVCFSKHSLKSENRRSQGCTLGEFTDNMRPLQNSPNLYKPPQIIYIKKKSTSICQTQGQHPEIKTDPGCSQTCKDVDWYPPETQPTHIRQRCGREPRRREAHLYCINNFRFNLAPIKKPYFPWAGIQRRHCQTKAAIRGVDILKEDESAWNPLFANYSAHISSGWSILCPLRLSNIHNTKMEKYVRIFLTFFI